MHFVIATRFRDTCLSAHTVRLLCTGPFNVRLQLPSLITGMLLLKFHLYAFFAAPKH